MKRTCFIGGQNILTCSSCHFMPQALLLSLMLKAVVEQTIRFVMRLKDFSAYFFQILFCSHFCDKFDNLSHSFRTSMDFGFLGSIQYSLQLFCNSSLTDNGLIDDIVNVNCNGTSFKFKIPKEATKQCRQVST